MTITTSSTVILAQEDPGISNTADAQGNTTYTSNGNTYVTTVENYNNTFLTTNNFDSPGGVNYSVQYNRDGNLEGSGSFSFNPGSNVVTVPGLVVTQGAILGSVGNVKIYGGSAGQALTTDGLGNLSWGAGGGGGSAAGGNTQIQYSDGNTFAANAFFTYNSVTQTQTVPTVSANLVNSNTVVSANTLFNTVNLGNVAANTVALNSSISTATTASTGSNQPLYSINGAQVRSLEFAITASDGSFDRLFTRISVVNLGINTNWTEYSTVWINNDFVTFSVVQSAGIIQLLATPATANTVNYSIVAHVYN